MIINAAAYNEELVWFDKGQDRSWHHLRSRA